MKKKNNFLINFTFFKNIFWERRWTILTYSLIVVLYGTMLISMYPSIQKSNFDLERLMSSYPKAFMEAFGVNLKSFNTIEGFLSVEYFSAIWPLIIGILIFSLGASFVAQEREKGTCDFSFSLPISRKKILLSKFLAAFLIVSFIVAITLFSTFLLVKILLTKSLFKKGFFMFFIDGIFLSFFLLSFATLLSCIFDNKGKVYGICGGFFLLSYILHILKGVSEKVADFYFLSFFKYYGIPENILLTGEISKKYLLVFLLAGALFLLLGFLIIEKRDI